MSEEFDFRAWRERMGMTRAEVAEALDVSLSWLQSVEIGRRASNGRLLELACRYIEGHHRAVAAMEDEPSPPAPDLAGLKVDIMGRFDALQAQLRAMAGAAKPADPARALPQDPATAGIPPGMVAPQRPRYVMPAPPTLEELDRMEAHARMVREMQEAEAAREAEEGE